MMETTVPVSNYACVFGDVGLSTPTSAWILKVAAILKNPPGEAKTEIICFEQFWSPTFPFAAGK